MNVTAERYGQAVILTCRGELTVDSLEGFRRAVQHQLSDPPADGAAEATSPGVRDVVLDFQEVPFVDSAGLEYLLDLQEQLNERLGQVKIARADENVRKILEITRLDGAFELYEDVAEAAKMI